MLIYSTFISPRLSYITHFVAGELYDLYAELTVKITTDKAVFENYSGPKINYSLELFSGDHITIIPHGLLNEKGIHPQQISCYSVNGCTAFFKTGGDLSFDIFAASFYLLSRYEEYLPHQQDMYGRYAYENSIAYRENFLDQPLINTWLHHLRKLLAEKFPDIPVRKPAFTFIPTYDIDEAYSYKYKEWWRSAGGAIKNLLKGQWKKWNERRNVIANKQPDPFDSYSWIDDLHRPHTWQPHYFFLVAPKTGKYDRNILPSVTAMQTLVQQHAKKYTVGVHPSWQSGDDTALLKKEIQTLEQITQLRITASRQHFIRLSLPATYRNLVEAGIKADFSMGYGSINGFRASVASPFYWYDLVKEETTYLLLHPFCYMEANSFYEQKFTADHALDEMRHYYHVVKAVNGTLITIWHNTFLGTGTAFTGWRDTYYQFVEELAKNERL